MPGSTVLATNIIVLSYWLHGWLAVHHLAVQRRERWHLGVPFHSLHKRVVVVAHVAQSPKILSRQAHLLRHESISAGSVFALPPLLLLGQL